jgi:mTERF domain-containing protein, mitochondrial
LLNTFDIDRSMARINLLREYGLTDQQITKLITRLGGLLFHNFDSLRGALERTEELGFSRGSNMFFHAFVVVGSLKKETFENKIAVFMKVCGWSEEEVYTAIRKSPSIFGISTDTLMAKMDFLVKIAGIEPKIIASQPILLTYGLESRLIPRYNVLSALQTKGLVKKLSLRTLCTLSEISFIQRYIVPYEKVVPELRAVYGVVSEKNLIPGHSLGYAQPNDSKIVSFW